RRIDRVMSQSKRRSGGNQSGSQRSQGSQGSQAPRGTKGGSQEVPRSRSSTQGAMRQTPRGGGRQSQPARKSNIDRTLPPFTTRRYLAIWAAGMVPLVLVL